ncbi:MAG: HD domain-containing protein [Candidatus Woesebacteria bacterium]|jgi:HD superfamily phosphohydrolase
MKIIYDRLYGQLQVSDHDLKLFQTEELTRLRQVSLSAVPPWTLPVANSASKFEHSVGTAHLARIVAQKSEFKEFAKDLYFAALAHDIATPPFSHVTEYFQIKLFGKNHEEFAEDVLDRSELANLMKKQGTSIKRIIDLINGRGGVCGDLVNGSIDLDNLDNSLRFALSIGLISQLLYSPEAIAELYAIENNQLILLIKDRKDLEAWELTRKIVYDLLYTELNLSPALMMYRALDLAFQENELKKEFFLMTDAEAFSYLEHNCNPKTQIITRRARKWQFYPTAYSFSTNTASKKLRDFFLDIDNRTILADKISSQFKIKAEDITVYFGKGRGFKKIHLPIFAKAGEIEEYVPSQQERWMAYIFLHSSELKKAEGIRELMDSKIKNLKN